MYVYSRYVANVIHVKELFIIVQSGKLEITQMSTNSVNSLCLLGWDYVDIYFVTIC